MSKAAKDAMATIRRHIENACNKLSKEDYDTVLADIAEYVEACQDARADDRRCEARDAKT